MGEEKKDELKENKEEKIEPVVLKVDMHCLGCAGKVKRSIKTYKGVEDMLFDMKLNTVTVKGNVDPLKLRERVQKKSGRRTEILSPLPKKENVEEKEKVEDKGKDKKPEKVPVTVVLKVWMHCDGCAQQVQRIILKMKGVQEAFADFTNNRVIVKGMIEPKKLVDYVYRKTGKHAQVVPPPPPKIEEEGEKKQDGKKEAEEVKKDEDKKEEEKKDDGNKKEGEEKKEEAKTDEKKDSGEEVKKEGEKVEGEEKKVEAGKEEEKKTGGEETVIVSTVEEKKNEFSAPKYVIEHVYPPQLFSDENPNACSIM
ncbi:hypothetical protein SUGI_1186030 [Cryptomeria japonica]|uniref:heavy metal-associated isoprenylated plant protein 7 n=1 Tax=Cryptomeria japonica TaxID=3369 RepID=UPI00241476E3|nr:heavy metal-associated isoprenylated plant protein 7 [Cryptomeria japonica]GLJ55269.1 hypothetical protein SUGI_1186030 [Cryptomeria japonica]